VPSILIVEDDHDICRFIAINLKIRGYEILQAETAQEGLHLLRDFAPQLLILDIRLSGMTGWEMLNVIDNDPTLSKLPVILMTASVLPDQANEYSYANVVAKLTKPFDTKALLRAVSAAV
jgi:CheY-like chemotaxis protein